MTEKTEISQNYTDNIVREMDSFALKLKEFSPGLLSEWKQLSETISSRLPQAVRPGAAAGQIKSSSSAAAFASGRFSSAKPKTMRVSQESIDSFLHMVGELVVVGEMYGHIQKRLARETSCAKEASDFKKNNENFNELLALLQKGILDIRRVPLRSLFQRIPRIVHDIAAPSGKDIRVEIKGADTVIDKSLLESLDSPLMHIVRNAADHGIETSDVRLSSGKAPEGRICVCAEEEESVVCIRVSDDGAGLDCGLIGSKALSLGLVNEEELSSMTEQEILRLIFAPGFSTAQQVSEVSGRGVGLDVAMCNIEKAGGSIHIESQPAEGCSFCLKLPRTVVVNIIEGFLFTLGRTSFVLPVKNVGESFEVKPEMLNTLPSGQKSLLRHGRVFSVIDLACLLGVSRESNSEFAADSVGVIVTDGLRECVCLVDAVLGAQQVVVKEIKGIARMSAMVAGGAVLGDERVAIVLCAEKLFNGVPLNSPETDSRKG